MFADRYVILGGHRDAWVFGGIDPMSGAALTHEAVRSAGKLLRKGRGGGTFVCLFVCVCAQSSLCVSLGWRPRRTIIFASWDAEEFGLLGSTEWAEVPHPHTHTHSDTHLLTPHSLVNRIMRSCCRTERWPTSTQTLP